MEFPGRLCIFLGHTFGICCGPLSLGSSEVLYLVHVGITIYRFIQQERNDRQGLARCASQMETEAQSNLEQREEVIIESILSVIDDIWTGFKFPLHS